MFAGPTFYGQSSTPAVAPAVQRQVWKLRGGVCTPDTVLRRGSVWQIADATLADRAVRPGVPVPTHVIGTFEGSGAVTYTGIAVLAEAARWQRYGPDMLASVAVSLEGTDVVYRPLFIANREYPPGTPVRAVVGRMRPAIQPVVGGEPSDTVGNLPPKEAPTVKLCPVIGYLTTAAAPGDVEVMVYLTAPRGAYPPNATARTFDHNLEFAELLLRSRLPGEDVMTMSMKTTWINTLTREAAKGEVTNTQRDRAYRIGAMDSDWSDVADIVHPAKRAGAKQSSARREKAVSSKGLPWILYPDVIETRQFNKVVRLAETKPAKVTDERRGVLMKPRAPGGINYSKDEQIRADRAIEQLNEFDRNQLTALIQEAKNPLRAMDERIQAMGDAQALYSKREGMFAAMGVASSLYQALENLIVTITWEGINEAADASAKGSADTALIDDAENFLFSATPGAETRISFVEPSRRDKMRDAIAAIRAKMQANASRSTPVTDSDSDVPELLLPSRSPSPAASSTEGSVNDDRLSDADDDYTVPGRVAGSDEVLGESEEAISVARDNIVKFFEAGVLTPKGFRKVMNNGNGLSDTLFTDVYANALVNAETGDRILHLTVKMEKGEKTAILDYLLRKGAFPEERNNVGDVALHIAVDSGNALAINKLTADSWWIENDKDHFPLTGSNGDRVLSQDQWHDLLDNAMSSLFDTANKKLADVDDFGLIEMSAKFLDKYREKVADDTTRYYAIPALVLIGNVLKASIDPDIIDQHNYVREHGIWNRVQYEDFPNLLADLYSDEQFNEMLERLTLGIMSDADKKAYVKMIRPFFVVSAEGDYYSKDARTERYRQMLERLYNSLLRWFRGDVFTKSGVRENVFGAIKEACDDIDDAPYMAPYNAMVALIDDVLGDSKVPILAHAVEKLEGSVDDIGDIVSSAASVFFDYEFEDDANLQAFATGLKDAGALQILKTECDERINTVIEEWQGLSLTSKVKFAQKLEAIGGICGKRYIHGETRQKFAEVLQVGNTLHALAVNDNPTSRREAIAKLDWGDPPDALKALVESETTEPPSSSFSDAASAGSPAKKRRRGPRRG